MADFSERNIWRNSFAKVVPKNIRGGVKNGFSLVEILVVLVILAIISAGAMMIMGKSTDKAKFTTAQKDLDIIQRAFTQYYNLVWNFEGVVNNAPLESCFNGTHDGVPRQDILQSFVGKRLSDYNDPWGRPYIIKSNYDSTSNTGAILVIVQEIAGAPNYSPGETGGVAVGNILSDKVTKVGDVEAPMYRIIYNTSF